LSPVPRPVASIGPVEVSGPAAVTGALATGAGAGGAGGWVRWLTTTRRVAALKRGLQVVNVRRLSVVRSRTAVSLGFTTVEVSTT